MNWLPHLILLTGTVIAATMGFALTALVVRNTLVTSSPSSDSLSEAANNFFSAEFTEWPVTTVRGYDTPELRYEDALARSEHPDESYFH